jgi:hypothetical protein
MHEPVATLQRPTSPGGLKDHWMTGVGRWRGPYRIASRWSCSGSGLHVSPAPLLPMDDAQARAWPVMATSRLTAVRLATGSTPVCIVHRGFSSASVVGRFTLMGPIFGRSSDSRAPRNPIWCGEGGKDPLGSPVLIASGPSVDIAGRESPLRGTPKTRNRSVHRGSW